MSEERERVYWTDEEKERLVTAAVSGLASHPSRYLLHIVQGILDQWPADRRRLFATLKAFPWFEPAFEKAWHDRFSLTGGPDSSRRFGSSAHDRRQKNA